MKRNVSTVGRTKHTSLLPRKEPLIRNGITIPSKKISGYVGNVIDPYYTTKPYFQATFAKVFAKPEL